MVLPPAADQAAARLHKKLLSLPQPLLVLRGPTFTSAGRLNGPTTTSNRTGRPANLDCRQSGGGRSGGGGAPVVEEDLGGEDY